MGTLQAIQLQQSVASAQCVDGTFLKGRAGFFEVRSQRLNASQFQSTCRSLALESGSLVLCFPPPEHPQVPPPLLLRQVPQAPETAVRG